MEENLRKSDAVLYTPKIIAKNQVCKNNAACEMITRTCTHLK